MEGGFRNAGRSSRYSLLFEDDDFLTTAPFSFDYLSDTSSSNCQSIASTSLSRSETRVMMEPDIEACDDGSCRPR